MNKFTEAMAIINHVSKKAGCETLPVVDITFDSERDQACFLAEIRNMFQKEMHYLSFIPGKTSREGFTVYGITINIFIRK